MLIRDAGSFPEKIYYRSFKCCKKKFSSNFCFFKHLKRFQFLKFERKIKTEEEALIENL